jgi:iron complex outermembrane receptor protein
VGYYYRSFITPALDADKLFRRVTPKVGVSYLFGAARTVYANLGGGIEVPAGNETDPASTFGQDTVTAINPLLEPIRSTTYEVGFKDLSGAGAERALSWSYDLAVYTTSVVNEIVPYRGGRFYFTAGRARRSGAELSLDLRARAGVFGRSALTWQHHTYTEYLVDSVHYGRPGSFADYGGNRVVGVPNVMAQAELGADIPGWRAAQVRAGLSHTGAYFVDDANSVRVPAYTTFDLTAEVRQPIAVTQGWGIRGFVTIQNLADRRYIGSAFLNPDVVNGVPVAFEPGLPRTVVVSLSVGRLR